MFNTIDTFLLENVDRAVCWIEDWTFLSKKWMERLLIIVFIISAIVEILYTTSPKLIGICNFVLFLNIYFSHIQPESIRKRMRVIGFTTRIIWVILSIFSIILLIVSLSINKNVNYFIADFILMSMVTLMSYITVSNNDGHRGRAAKMAWNKIKELFGTSWIPQPINV